MLDALSGPSGHWPEYLIEAASLGLFMVSATVFAALLEHPAFGVARVLPSPTLRRALMGLVMGLTAVALIYSPMGQRSGAHMNPAVTLTFLALGRIAPHDALFYVLFQFAGGLAGCLAGGALVVPWTGGDAFRIVATVPGGRARAAFAGELAISFVLMLAVLGSSNSATWSRWTGVVAGTLVALFILVEAPLSGMSMNPARTVASALPSGTWRGLWIYLAAPPLGMLAAAALYTHVPSWRAPLCAKLQHGSGRHCIFRCDHAQLAAPDGAGAHHE